MNWLLSGPFLAVVAIAGAEDWSQFRGPAGTGVSADAPIPLEWSSAKHIAWRTPIPGLGWSQPVIIGTLVFVTSAVGDHPTRPKDFASGTSDPYTTSGGKASAPDMTVDWKVLALDLRTGAIKWERSAVSGKPRYPIHPSNTYASETPAADGRGVYAFFGAAGTVVGFDHEGQMLWRHEVGVFRQQENLGTASSPRLHHGLLYVQCFNEEQAFLVCLDAKDGQERWRITRNAAGSCWNTPLVWRNESRTELVVCGQSLMTSHDPLTGQELWRAAGVEMPGIPSVSADAQRLYFGYRSLNKGAPFYAFNAGSEGDQSVGEGERTFKAEAWRVMGPGPGMASPVVASGCVYVVNDTVLSCHDAATGQQHFKERLPGFRAVVASPIAVGDKIVIVDESGSGVVLKAGARFEVLGQSRLNDTFWASPATVDGALLLRGLDYLYCIRKKP